MRKIAEAVLCASALLALALAAQAQVLTIYEIKDPNARRLQSKYLQQLNDAGNEIQACHFPFSFYFSRQLDVDEAKQQRLDQRSMRFQKYNGQTVLEITGNYYAAYSAEVMDKGARAKKTFEDLVLPILKITVPKFPPDDSFAAFAIEVSHHVRRRVMGGVTTENAENLMFLLPRAAAHRLVTATTVDQQQAALLDSEVYVDADSFSLWLTDKHPAEVAKKKPAKPDTVEVASLGAPSLPADAPAPTVSTELMKGAPLPVRLITPATLAQLKSSYQDSIARMVQTLDAQAHFVAYAPPAFVAFHQGAYLEISLTSPLPDSAGSQYRLAALAWDDHIVHLVRPVLAFFQQASDFDGVSFSTTVKTASGGNQAVEYFLPFPAMRCFANYDCTGQQLIDAGVVLINGERAGLRLDAAEAAK